MQVEVLADTTFNNNRITTFHCCYPQIIHEHILTHRVFSRNSMSGRAMSTKRFSELEPIQPLWSHEQSGMDSQPLNNELQQEADNLLTEHYISTLEFCKKLHNLGVHHQDINVYLKPFVNIHTIITSTEWDNFFQLRAFGQSVHPMMNKLALLMHRAYTESIPKKSQYHVPFALVNSEESFFHEAKIATARLARYSYFKDNDSIEANLKLHDRLLRDKHFSPFEHSAIAEPGNWYNLQGWKSYRYLIESVG